MSVLEKSKLGVTSVSRSIIVPVPVFNAVVDDLDHGKKIAAIKKIRKEGNLDLRTAKEAVEKLASVKQLGSHPGPIKHHALDIHPSPMISSLVIDVGDGPVEVNVDTLQMKILTKLGSVGLDTCADMLHIVDVIQAINDGKNVIIEEPEHEES